MTALTWSARVHAAGEITGNPGPGPNHALPAPPSVSTSRAEKAKEVNAGPRRAPSRLSFPGASTAQNASH